MSAARFIAILGIIAIYGTAYAAHAKVIKIFISSGTGFVVSRDGHIVTNKHVVSYCQRIMVTGSSVSLREAKVIARDKTQDLALLQMDGGTSDVGVLRSQDQPVQAGDRVVIVGYPGESAQEGVTVTREAEVTNPAGPQGEDKWLELSDVIEQGNSGGPLLDASGNVVGVVTAKATIYSFNREDPHNGTTRNSGIAINLKALREFLDMHRVYYREEESGSDLSAHRVTDLAHRFTVNVRCEYKTEVR